MDGLRNPHSRLSRARLLHHSSALSIFLLIAPILSDHVFTQGLTVYKGLKHANSLPGEWIAIPGAGGGLGHIAIQLARNMGPWVLAIDSGENKRKLCMDLDAEQWLDFAQTSNIVADVQRLTNDGPRTALVAAGDAKPYEQALVYLKPTGTLVAVGLGSDAVMQAPFMVWVGKQQLPTRNTVQPENHKERSQRQR